MNRIDFAGIISAIRCNPNGDPLIGGRPREDMDGYGLILDVCLKRKIRNRLEEYGYDILLTTMVTEGPSSLREKIKNEKDLVQLEKNKDLEQFRKLACEKWIDVRAFGHVFAFKDFFGNVSTGIRGPVSIGTAYSLEPIDVIDLQITRSINVNTPKNKYERDTSTMGLKYIVEKGIYVFYGSIFPQLAEKTGFNEDDAELIKQAMANMFDNDASSARPSGSMVMERLYWWTHNRKIGQYSQARVFRSLKVTPEENAPYFKVELDELPGLDVEIISPW